MTRQLLTLGVLVIATTLSGVAAAQHSHHHHGHQGHSHYTPGGGFYVPAYAYGYSRPGGASTYEGSVLQGMAAYTQAVGQANYYNSQAAINLQQANAQFIANQQLRTETYFRMKDINEAYKVSHQPTRLSTEGLRELAKRQAPDRLDHADYNRATGRLAWPEVLADASFADERDALNAVFAERSPSDAGAGSRFHSKVRPLVEAAQKKLQRQIATLSPADYLAAKKFLTGLSYEAQQPVVGGALAAR